MSDDLPDIRVVSVSWDTDRDEPLSIDCDGAGDFEAVGMLFVALFKKATELAEDFIVAVEMDDEDGEE